MATLGSTLKQESNTSTREDAAAALSPINIADSVNSAPSLTNNDSTEVNLNERPPSPTCYIKCEVIENEVIDVDAWYADRLKSDEEKDYAVKTELISQVEASISQVTSVNLSGDQPSTSDHIPPPRIASVASGFSSPPIQIEHPEIMLNRICICSKKAEFVCQCLMAIYCSRECQVNNWTNHQELCLRTRKQ